MPKRKPDGYDEPPLQERLVNDRWYRLPDGREFLLYG